MSPTEPGLRVCYILKMFPRLSETFILNEILELEHQGVQVSVGSLMYPNDGRFHGRLGGLDLTVEYFPREKPEMFWSLLRGDLADHAPPLAAWEGAADFLKRHAILKDFDLLLRAAVLAARLRELDVQHVHAHFATIATRVAALVHLMTGIPFSFTSHAKDIYRETVDRDLYRELVDLAAFNITVSDFNRQFLLEHTPRLDAEKVVRLYNGIDLEYFRPADHDRRDPRHLVSVGRLVPKKGFHHLLRTMRRLQDENRKLRLTIVGDGEERANLLELHRSLGLGETVRFAGALPQEEVRRIYDSAAMSVLACVPDEIGNRDALPTTLLESLACGVPAVSTRLTGVPEILDHEVGSIVEPGDEDGMARAIVETLERTDDALRARCRERAEELFDLRRNVATLRRRFQASAHERPVT